MDKCDVIDLCSIKSEKSVDTSTTIPLGENADLNTTAFGMVENESHASGLFVDEDHVKTDLTEHWIREQNATIPSFNDSLKQEIQLDDLQFKTSENSHPMDIAVVIPTEITDLVNKECVIKLINYLVIYAINKVTELDLRRKLLSVTPDIDPQINYRSTIGFQCIYERCAVLFYEALLDLTEILQQFKSPLKDIVVLWMYKTVENICKAHAIDGTFLRNDKYIEILLRDFMISQEGVPEPGNIFFNIYQKMQPTVIDTHSFPNQQHNTAGPSRKKRGRPRTKLGKTTSKIV